LQFEASRGYSSKSDIAIDDISLSRECFGIGNFNIILNILYYVLTISGYLIFAYAYFFSTGVPREVVGNFNYYTPVIESEIMPPQHPDFVNETGT